MARVTVKTLGEVSEIDKARLRELTLGGGSGMNQDVLDRTHNLQAFHCFLAREEGYISGWAAVFPAHRSVPFHRQIENNWRGDHGLNVYVYVDPNRRGNGLGRHLLRRVTGWLRKQNTRGRIFAWSRNSTEFYDLCLDSIENARDTLEIDRIW